MTVLVSEAFGPDVHMHTGGSMYKLPSSMPAPSSNVAQNSLASGPSSLRQVGLPPSIDPGLVDGLGECMSWHSLCPALTNQDCCHQCLPGRLGRASGVAEGSGSVVSRSRKLRCITMSWSFGPLTWMVTFSSTASKVQWFTYLLTIAF